MRVLVVGASGLIGSAVVARLHRCGHRVVAAAHRHSPSALQAANADWVHIDLRTATDPQDWLPLLDGTDAVVNCAGVLQDSPRDAMRAVHLDGASALFSACVAAGVRRVIQLSAIGVDRETPTEFSRTKLAADRFLQALDLDWIILRPSVVVGRAAYGGSALFRALASLPVLPVLPGTGPLQIVQLDDVARTVEICLRPETETRVVLELAGPDRLSFEAVVAAYRQWLGWRRAPRLQLPGRAARIGFIAGDTVGWLGWRSPMRSTAQREIRRGAIGDPSEWTRFTGVVPHSLQAALAAEPASVQERWFAKLYVLKPVVLGVLALFWMATGVIALGPGFDAGLALMHRAGAGDMAQAYVIAGGVADIAIGVAIAVHRTARVGLYAGLAVTLFYLLASSWLVPALWSDPLGPLLKILPVLVLNCVALAILDER